MAEPPFKVGLHIYDEKWTSVNLERVETSCIITDLTADVCCNCIYKSDKAAEAMYTFPLNNVALYCFEAEVEGRKIVAECRPRNEAKTTYEEAVSTGHMAFMARQDEHCEDVFQMKLGAIPSGAEVTIRLKYVGFLEGENTDVDGKRQSVAKFVLPTVLNPRYKPSEVTNKGMFDSLLTAEVMKPYTFKFNGELYMPVTVLNVSSAQDNFEIDWISSDHKTAKVGLSSEFKSDHDLQMIIQMDRQLDSFAVCEPGNPQADGILGIHCLMTQWMPDFSQVQGQHELRTELYFVIDRSGSMMGDRINIASQSLLLFLKSIPVGCRFQIIGFGNSFDKLFPEPAEYNDTNVERALKYQRQLAADMGGTQVLPALKEAFRTAVTGVGWYKQIIFLTDGEVANADEVVGLVGSNIHQARVFTIGLGMGASPYLVEGVARAGRGVSAFIRENNELRTATMKILKSALQPRASNIQVHWDIKASRADGSQVPVEITAVPQENPPIFNGCFTSIYGLFKSVDPETLTGHITLECDVLSAHQTFRIDMADVVKRLHHPGSKEIISNLPLHRLAGKCQLNELSDKHKALIMRPVTDGSGDKKDEDKEPSEVVEIREKMERLSCSINVVCPVTAFIGVDPVKHEAISQPEPRPRIMAHVQFRYKSCMPGPMLRSCHMVGRPYFRGGSAALQARAFDVPDSGPMFQAESVGAECEVQDYNEPAEMDTLLKLADLQSPAGFWNLDEKVATCLGLTLAKLRNARPPYWSDSVKSAVSDTVWATALVLMYLELSFPNRLDEWSLFGQKARKWMEIQAISVLHDVKLANECCETVLKKAKSLIHPT